MANTYRFISSVTNGASNADLQLTSIPSTYTDLLLIVNGRSTRNTGGTGSLALKVNGSTLGASHYWVGNGSSGEYGTQAARWMLSYAPQNPSADSWGDNIYASSWFYLFNYSDTSYQKSGFVTNVAQNSGTYGPSFFGYNTNSSTTTISSLEIYNAEGFTVAAYSTAYLYGIKKD